MSEKDKNWSAKVMRESNALNLEKNIFTCKDLYRIALSLKHSAKVSHRRKFSPFRSAMSMLIFYVNRAGKNLDPEQRSILEVATIELRKLYDRS